MINRRIQQDLDFLECRAYFGECTSGNETKLIICEIPSRQKVNSDKHWKWNILKVQFILAVFVW